MASYPKFMQFETTDPLEIEQIIVATSDFVKNNETYVRTLTDEEKAQRREVHTDNIMKLADIQDEQKTANDAFKKRMDPIKEDNSKILHQLRTGQEDIKNQTLYGFKDNEAGVIHFYDTHGEKVKTRMMEAIERQGTIAEQVRNS